MSTERKGSKWGRYKLVSPPVLQYSSCSHLTETNREPAGKGKLWCAGFQSQHYRAKCRRVGSKLRHNHVITGMYTHTHTHTHTYLALMITIQHTFLFLVKSMFINYVMVCMYYCLQLSHVLNMITFPFLHDVLFFLNLIIVLSFCVLNFIPKILSQNYIKLFSKQTHQESMSPVLFLTTSFLSSYFIFSSICFFISMVKSSHIP